MGSCSSCCCKDEGSSQIGEPSETTTLIPPVANNANISRVNSENVLSYNYNTLPKKTDEQSALNRILQETATNVIDVAAFDSHSLGQHDYLERMKIYNIKVQQVLTNNRGKLTFRMKSFILQDIHLPEKVLSSGPLSLDDINLITSSVVAASTAISDIKVDHKEDLVVPFGLSC